MNISHLQKGALWGCENQGTHGETDPLGTLSDLWRGHPGALRAEYGRPAHRATPRPETFRSRGRGNEARQTITGGEPFGLLRKQIIPPHSSCFGYGPARKATYLYPNSSSAVRLICSGPVGDRRKHAMQILGRAETRSYPSFHRKTCRRAYWRVETASHIRSNQSPENVFDQPILDSGSWPYMLLQPSFDAKPSTICRQGIEALSFRGGVVRDRSKTRSPRLGSGGDA